jgi:hypothetical protein
MTVEEAPIVEAEPPAEDDSLYAQLVRDDVVKLLEPLLAKRRFHLRAGDGKIVSDSWSMLYDTPWHYTIPAYELDCWTWTEIMFETVGRGTSRRFVPSMCQWCFKVVCRMKTLRQLFAMKALQERLQLPGKCGIEVRPLVHGNYGSYFYNRGLEEGQRNFEIIRQSIHDDPELGPELAAGTILKRGCTEMELTCGPSDKWEVTANQLRVEKMINQVVVRDPYQGPMPPHVVKHTLRKWIEFAYSIGDETYKLYTGGRPLYRQPVVYHDKAAETAE